MVDQDRRRAPRISTSIEVRYQCGTDSYIHHTMDLSLRGLYIVTGSPLKVGSPVTVSFSLPGFDHSFNIKGSVVRNNLGGVSEGPPGMGIEFVDLDKEDERVLVQFVVQSQLTQKGY